MCGERSGEMDERRGTAIAGAGNPERGGPSTPLTAGCGESRISRAPTPAGRVPCAEGCGEDFQLRGDPPGCEGGEGGQADVRISGDHPLPETSDPMRSDIHTRVQEKPFQTNGF